jgi:hypothetical protein
MTPGKSSDDFEAKWPDHIIIDDPQADKNSQDKAEFFDSFYRMEKRSYPLPFRAFTFTASIILFICSAIVTLFFVISLGIGLLGLYQNEALNRPLMKFWGILKKILVFAMGFFLASFNPAFGFGFILLYFMMHGEKVNPILMSRFMKQ